MVVKEENAASAGTAVVRARRLEDTAVSAEAHRVAWAEGRLHSRWGYRLCLCGRDRVALPRVREERHGGRNGIGDCVRDVVAAVGSVVVDDWALEGAPRFWYCAWVDDGCQDVAINYEKQDSVEEDCSGEGRKAPRAVVGAEEGRRDDEVPAAEDDAHYIEGGEDSYRVGPGRPRDKRGVWVQEVC